MSNSGTGWNESGGRIFDAAGLDQVAWCPMGEACEVCGAEDELNIETVLTQVGIFCVILCDTCTEAGRVPKMYAPQAVHRVLEHCGHLGITADYMAQLLRKEAAGPT